MSAPVLFARARESALVLARAETLLRPTDRFDPDQPRDDEGRWIGTGGGVAGLGVLDEDEYGGLYGEAVDEKNVKQGDDAGVYLTVRYFENGDAHAVTDFGDGAHQVLVDGLDPDMMRAVADAVEEILAADSEVELSGDLFYVGRDAAGDVQFGPDADHVMDYTAEEADGLVAALREMADGYEGYFADSGSAAAGAPANAARPGVRVVLESSLFFARTVQSRQRLAKYDPTQKRDDNGRWTDGVPGPDLAVADKLKLGKLAPAGFTVRSSKKVKTDYADIGIAEVDSPDGPQVRVGIITAESGKWDAGFSGDERKAQLRRDIAQKQTAVDAAYEADAENEQTAALEDEISELEGELESLDEERTAILSPGAVADLRRQLGDGFELAKANKTKQDATSRALDALDEQRDEIISEFSNVDLERRIDPLKRKVQSAKYRLRLLRQDPEWFHAIPEAEADVAEAERQLEPLLAERAALMPPDATARLADLDRQAEALREDDIDGILSVAEVSSPDGSRVVAEIRGSDDNETGWVAASFYVLRPGETTDDADGGESYGSVRGLRGLSKLIAGLESAGEGPSVANRVQPGVRVVLESSLFFARTVQSRQRLAKYDPTQKRDDNGRWTDGMPGELVSIPVSVLGGEVTVSARPATEGSATLSAGGRSVDMSVGELRQLRSQVINAQYGDPKSVGVDGVYRVVRNSPHTNDVGEVDSLDAEILISLRPVEGAYVTETGKRVSSIDDAPELEEVYNAEFDMVIGESPDGDFDDEPMVRVGLKDLDDHNRKGVYQALDRATSARRVDTGNGPTDVFSPRPGAVGLRMKDDQGNPVEVILNARDFRRIDEAINDVMWGEGEGLDLDELANSRDTRVVVDTSGGQVEVRFHGRRIGSDWEGALTVVPLNGAPWGVAVDGPHIADFNKALDASGEAATMRNAAVVLPRGEFTESRVKRDRKGRFAEKNAAAVLSELDELMEKLAGLKKHMSEDEKSDLDTAMDYLKGIHGSRKDLVDTGGTDEIELETQQHDLTMQANRRDGTVSMDWGPDGFSMSAQDAEDVAEILDDFGPRQAGLDGDSELVLDERLTSSGDTKVILWANGMIEVGPTSDTPGEDNLLIDPSDPDDARNIADALEELAETASLGPVTNTAVVLPYNHPGKPPHKQSDHGRRKKTLDLPDVPEVDKPAETKAEPAPKPKKAPAKRAPRRKTDSRREGVEFAQDEVVAPGQTFRGNESIRSAADAVAGRWDISDADLEALAREDGIWDEHLAAVDPADRKASYIRGLLGVWTGSSGGPIAVRAVTGVLDRLGAKYELGEFEKPSQQWFTDRPNLDRAVKSLGEAMYGNTQDWLATRKVGSVRLLRNSRRGAEWDAKRPFTSWSVSRGGTVLVGDGGPNAEFRDEVIPAERIFSLPATGYGNAEEWEFVVLPPLGTANKGKATDRITESAGLAAADAPALDGNQGKGDAGEA